MYTAYVSDVDYHGLNIPRTLIWHAVALDQELASADIDLDKVTRLATHVSALSFAAVVAATRLKEGVNANRN